MEQLNQTFNFGVALKTFPTEGNLVYEYNPFHNYRLDRTMISYKNQLMEIEEFCKEVGITEEELKTKSSWDSIIPASETPPIVYQKGQLVDFETNELKFSLNNPVNITPQWSYDNSVNLIINDGLNPPRLVNSRFSITERNKYQVCNRSGNNDSNIYDQGDQFDIDTSLYKKITTIPRIKFLGTMYGGNLSIGNYHFYFKYVDEDGNESDFFAESGLVSIFIGNSADSIRSGFRQENSYKLIRFQISNTDPGYSKVVIYYTVSTSDIYENAAVSAYRIDHEYNIYEKENTVLIISGFEPVTEVTLDDINVFYQIYGSAETQAAAQNMLFLANVDRPKIPYQDLADCALRFIPTINSDEKYNYQQIGIEYNGPISNTYYDSNYIYNKVGYWDDEIYRLGVVFIQKDNTLTDVFNIRGGVLQQSSTIDSFTDVPLFDDNDNRVYINYDEQYYSIVDDSTDNTKSSSINLENARGVIQINCSSFSTVIGINITTKQEVLDYLLNDLGIKGFFFVRQKRIPTTLCQAYTIGIDKQSNTPVLPLQENESFITESFLTQDERLLDHSFEKRIYTLEPQQVLLDGAICPEYDVNSPYLNTLFSGSELVVRNCSTTNYLTREGIHFYPSSLEFTKGEGYTKVKIIGVEDNTKLVAIGDTMFSARAGEAEEAFKFEYIGKENVHTEASNLLRGSYGPFLGITGYENAGHLIDIKIPEYSAGYIDNYFNIRYNDKSSYYAISDRFDLQNTTWWLSKNGDIVTLKNPLYRGDCYICQFTHRINRNFQDPSSPSNDDIVDPECWKDHFEVSDDVIDLDNFDEINLGDVNAIRLGMYITLIIRSTANLNIRTLDDSIPDEQALFGHARGFYPFYPMTASGAYKTPEALCYNKGFESSLSEKYNQLVPEVPWIKNEFSNRIAYSNIQITDAFQNGWRTFIGTHYKDYPKTYGSITKIVEVRGNLLCVFEHGVALIPVNERAVAGEGAGGYAYINTSNVLPENPKVLSDTFGSQWRESVIKTPRGIYGVDTIGKKIWRTNGFDTFECISDFKVQEFLNKNISLTERELDPIIGVRNVKSHFNRFKNDVMFTFYDNLHGFEEKAWNLCWNEDLQKWITFYSWVPSYSENIYNQYFSFDRNTSKWIAKLGVSHYNNDFSDGITLENNIISNNSWETILHLSNRNLPQGDNISYDISYSLERDNYQNYKLFDVYDTGEKDENGLSIWKIKLKDGVVYDDIYSEFYERDDSGKILKDDRGRRIWLPSDLQKNPDKIVRLLNIRASIKIAYTGEIASLEEAYSTGYVDRTFVDSGYYESVVAIIPQYNMQFLTTDFWKHGQAGIIDIADKIYPTYWYGKQHPFEFEFIVADNPQAHKIFDNLQIISNNAEPESFHYEIIGDCYDFAKDKKNMYIRQEATKELYQYNGCDITYDHDYEDIEDGLITLEETTKSRNQQNPKTPIEYYHRPLSIDENYRMVGDQYDKSTIFPLYYSRQDTINEIEDSYHLKDNESTKDFSALAGGEIIHDTTTDEYRIWNHCKAVDMQKKGRLRGNMQYNEDKWLVQINSLNVVYKNESEWTDLDGNSTNRIPVEIGQSPVPDNVLSTNIEVPEDFETTQDNKGRGYVSWSWDSSQRREVKIKDKWIKIRVRYTGNKLAVISAIKTLYSISFS